MQVIEWTARATPALEPAGVVATGEVAQRLLRALHKLTEQELSRLSVVATRHMLVVIGANSLLPWVDGVRYCAPDPVTHDLWLPTHLMPRLATDLLQANLARRVSRKPLLLWHEPEHILPLDQPMTISYALLAWLQKELAP